MKTSDEDRDPPTDGSASVSQAVSGNTLLAELLSGMSAEDVYPETATGFAVGAEVLPDRDEREDV
ncbi:hypothetical protein [Salinarimonas ramus]|uniref:Uncharacterized protein n=1 Tax=Salinarimonas ramus TaxID=690164 RepID=A0A917V944_9HYPH|nr:hypothetical protein [Salinarimonas ramus]GGK50635.1 hypothetical protein GCM10011322_42120 [Salinarimonas ramus]